MCLSHFCQILQSLHFQVSSSLLSIPGICSAATISAAPDNPQHGVGRKLEMTCDCPSKPSATIAWFKDGNQLTNGGPISISGNQLVIDKLQLSDSGSYTCNGSNIVGTMNSPPKDIQVISELCFFNLFVLFDMLSSIWFEN